MWHLNLWAVLFKKYCANNNEGNGICRKQTGKSCEKESRALFFYTENFKCDRFTSAERQ
jgi:hypothetical protein